MSREIKFRAWDLEKRRYGEVRCINYNFEGEIDSVVCWFSVHEREVYLPGGTFVLEQDTGVKDKNGKEIYEGDILVQFDDDYFVVKYENGGFYPFANSFPRTVMTDEIEIIGNIHENPEIAEGAR